MKINLFGEIVCYVFMLITSFSFLSHLVAGKSAVLPGVVLLVFLALARTYRNSRKIEEVTNHEI